MTSQVTQYHGGCYCKAVRYTITPDGPPRKYAFDYVDLETPVL